jgi:hypothetical protein
MINVTINIDGELSASEARRLSNAVLALGGVSSHENEITLKLDGTQLEQALRETVAKLEESEHPSAALGEAVGLQDDIATARATFGGGGPLAPSVADTPAVAAPLPIAPAAPPVTLAPNVVPPAPPPPVAPAAPNAATGRVPVVDSAGYEWDERIHASSRARIQSDNTWKLKRGVQEHLVESVRAEYDARQGRAVAPPVANAMAEAQPPAPPAPPAPAAPTVIDFPTLVGRVQEAVTTGKISKVDIDNYLVTQLQVANLREIVTNPAAIAQFNAHFFPSV